MADYPIVNKKMVRLNSNLKRNQKEYRKSHGRGSRRLLKNYIGKLVRLSSAKPIKDCPEPVRYRMEGPEKSVLIEMVRQANLTGMSGNGFPVAEKLMTFAQSSGRKILIINAVECEPGLLQDEWILEKKAQAVRMGITYLQQAFHFDQKLLATKRSTTDVGAEERVVPGRYPMGEEHFLIQEVLGIQLGQEEVPAEKGILVMNLQTILQISQIVNECYVEGHYITLANLTTGEARITYVTTKDSIRKLLEQVYPAKGKYFFAGHGLLGAHPVEKGEVFTPLISFAAVSPANPVLEAAACKKCGACSRKCPMGLKIKEIVQRLEQNPAADISQFHPERCIGCGSCTYYCHAAKNVGKLVRREE